MRKLLLVTTSIAGLGLALPMAQAADVLPPEPVSNWTAIHIGIGGGAGYNSYDATSTLDIDEWDSFIPSFIDIESEEGKLYGFGTVEIGADYQFDNSPLVIGVLGSYDFNGNSESESSSDSASEDGFITANIQSELEDTWFVGGRAGIVFNDTSLVYGLVGYTWGKAKTSSLLGFQFFEFGDDFGASSEKKTVDGLTVGGGIEQLLTENISLKLEYRHDFLDSIKWDEAAFDPEWGGVDEDNNISGKTKFERDTIRAVLSWRFGL